MASNSLKAPMLRTVATRSYSAQAAVKQIPAACADIKTSVLPNKLTVASVDNNTPVSRISVLFRAGSRYENHDNFGSTHFLRIISGLATKCYSRLAITRHIQQVGGNLNVVTDRELISYTLETTRDELEATIDILGNVAAMQCLKPWELADCVPRLKYEVNTLEPTVKVIDFLHQAAFRTGLGNSLFCPSYAVGKINYETLQHYIKCHYTSNRTAVVGVGVDHDRLSAFAQNLQLDSGAGPDSPSSYKGGEIRLGTGAQVTHVAVATEGASLKNTKEALAFAVLQHALGVGPSVKWGSQITPLGKAVAGSLKDKPFAVTALNASYTDTGLFGILVASAPDAAGSAVQAAVKQLKSGSVSEDCIQRGKAQLKSNILMSVENGSDLLSEIGAQALLLGNVSSAASLASVIDSLQSSDVNAAAKKVASGKLSLAAVGNLSTVPYLDELK